MPADLREAFAENGGFISALVGLSGLARMVRALADAEGHPGRPAEPPDEFVHLLLAVVSLGDAVDRLARPEPGVGMDRPAAPVAPERPEPGGWLR